MTYSFNLIDQPWIPCIQMDGHVMELSLWETLAKSYELRSLQGDSPLETAALYRLLLAVLHSALRGPASRSEWAKLWNAKQWDMKEIDVYLNKWRSRFDLFDDERPFYQIKDKRVQPKSIITLVLDMASGNNASLFDHHLEEVGEELSPAKATRTLLAAQCFSLAGLSGIKGNTFTDAPWGRGVIFIVEDDTLFRTLMLNLIQYSEDKPLPSESNDAPAWEMDNPYQDDRDIPLGYLDYLTWQNRRILLIPEGKKDFPFVRQMTVAPGLRLNASLLDPLKHYRKDEDRGNLVLRFSEDRVLWRDSSALFRVQNPQAVRPPENFTWLSNLASHQTIDQYHAYRFVALGMANNQAKIDFFRQEHFPLPLEYLKQDALVEKLAEALLYAEQIRKSLWTSGSLMALLIVSPKSDGKSWKDIDRISRDQANGLYDHWGVDRLYWSALEIPFLDFLQALPNDPVAIARWKEILTKTAWDALSGAERLAGEGTASLKAAVKARSVLAYEFKKLSSKIEQKEAAV